MLYSLLRSPKVRQIGQVELNISVDGAAGTPVASGPDAAFVESITDNGTGDYTITLKEPSKMPLHVSSIVVVGEIAASFLATATPKQSFKILTTDLAGAAADGAFNVQIKFMDQLANYY